MSPETPPSGRLWAVAQRHLPAAFTDSARRRPILLFIAILSLQSADNGAIGALAPQLERSFHIGNTELGLLVTASSLTGAFASLPMGVLTDRTRRVRLLTISIVLWTAGMIATGLAGSYPALLVSRLGLGAVMAVAGPAIPSLIGDLFDPAERSRIYGFVLTGDLLGAGAGLLIAGDLGAAAGWRLAFFVLAVPSAVLAVLLHRLLPEPDRGGRSRLHPSTGQSGSISGSYVRRQIEQREDVGPDRSKVLRCDPTRMGAWPAARYVLGIPTNRLLIVSSALGYFFFAGLRTFAVIFARGRFGISQATVSALLVVIGAGAVAGTLWGGQITDRLLHRGRTNARLLIGGAGFVAAATVLIPGFAFSSMAACLPIFVLAAGLLSLPNPALDAARLDVVPALLWGRAEAVRTFVRTVLEAFAPLLFGLVSAVLGSGSLDTTGGIGSSHQVVSRHAAAGLSDTFLIMLAPLAAGGLLLLRGRHRYLTDAATAGASDHPDSEGVDGGTTRAC